MFAAVVPAGTALAYPQANPTRALPGSVQRGKTFNVTVNFTAPGNSFTIISIIDLAPAGWNVTVNETWCTPVAASATATGNKTQIMWGGSFNNGTFFTAVYKVAVPENASEGFHTFTGSLGYYLDGAPYRENITGDSQVPLPPELEGHVTFSGRGAAPQATWVQTFVVKGFAPGITPNATNALWTRSATTDEYGVFIVPDLDAGTYDIGIKNCTCLSELETGVVLTVGYVAEVYFAPIREGDCDENDMVTAGDRGLLYDGWNSANIIQQGHLCDLNRDGGITAADRGLLYDQWNTGGAAYGGF